MIETMEDTSDGCGSTLSPLAKAYSIAETIWDASDGKVYFGWPGAIQDEGKRATPLLVEIQMQPFFFWRGQSDHYAIIGPYIADSCILKPKLDGDCSGLAFHSVS